jgi:hypothetical protein
MGLRLTGPAASRFVIQPIVAILLGIRDGIKDARAGAPPFIYDIVTAPADRKRQAGNAWKGIGKSFIVAVVLDAIVQFLILGTVYPGAALIVGIGLMGLPYAIARGWSNRIASRLPMGRKTADKPER